MEKIKNIWLLAVLATFLIWGSFFGPLYYTKVVYLQALAGLGLFLFKDLKLTYNSITLALVALFGFASLSSFWATEPSLAALGLYWRGYGLIFYFCLFILLLIFYSLLNAKKQEMISSYIGSITILAAINLIDTFFIRKAPSIFSTGNPNANGFLFGSTFLLALNYRHLIKKHSNFLFIFITSLLLLATALTGSRSASGALILCSILYSANQSKSSLKVTITSLSIVGIAISIFHFFINPNFFNGILERTKEFHRLSIWKGAFDAFLERPFLGWGYNGLYEGFSFNFPGVLGSGFQWIDNAHSLPLNILSELGLVGLLFFLALLFFFFQGLRNSNERSFWISFWLFIGVYLLVQPLYIEVLLSLTLYLTLFLSKQSLKELNFKNYFGIPVAILILVISFMQFQNLYKVKKARIALASAKDYRPYWNAYLNDFHLIDKAGALYDLSNQLTFNYKSGNSADKTIFSKLALNEFEKLEDNYQHRPRFLDMQGIWLMRAGKFREADKKFDLLLNRSPNNSNLIFQKAESAVAQGNKLKAVSLFEKSEKLDPKNLQTKMNLAKLYAENGYRTLAKEKLKEALELSPGNKQIEEIYKRFDK